ncbi:Uncharacterized protein PECH_005398 [Penicillium ucsense]|uniref:Ubiquinone biosynthesis protein n=1 Tax=Penicillium ucsense TaxID=2839758 RepID=A0A8J8WG96_9EURO|nr:Uncharacterized protein PECM_007604 [Penicillium ucsense]KAF7736421.1 Uncharacterized protein PECH_005398 [Penicillium ucsense]
MASLPRLYRARTSLSAIPSLRASHQPGAVASYHAPANSTSTSTSTARSSPISSSSLISNSTTISQAQLRTPTPLCIRARARARPDSHAQCRIQTPLHPWIRTYHSSLHPRPPTHEYNNSQVAILSASLAHIPTEGFTRAALTAGARDAGFLDVSVQLLPRGEFDLVLFWLASRRGLLRAKVEDGCVFGETAATAAGDRTGTGSGSGPSVDEKVRILIMERLRMNKDVKGVWQDALAQMSLLGNIPLAFSELHALSNDILNLAGDTAVDSTWYARRMAIGAIYASAEMAMTRDPTPDMVETEAFVKRRFEDKQALKDKVEGVGSWVGFWGNTVVGVGRSWGLKI